MKVRHAIAMLEGLASRARSFANKAEQLKLRIVTEVETGAIDSEAEIPPVYITESPHFALERVTLQRITTVIEEAKEARRKRGDSP